MQVVHSFSQLFTKLLIVFIKKFLQESKCNFEDLNDFSSNLFRVIFYGKSSILSRNISSINRR